MELLNNAKDISSETVFKATAIPYMLLQPKTRRDLIMQGDLEALHKHEQRTKGELLLIIAAALFIIYLLTLT